MTLQQFTEQMRALIRSAVAKARDDDGLTWAESGQLFIQFLQLAIEAATGLDISGPAKKEAVLIAIGELFDAVSPFIPLPWFLSPLRGILIPKLRTVVIAVASGAVEAIYAWFKRRFPDHLEPNPGA